ncbi:MAG: TrkH family potassium uptake protein [Verrucomicrobiota bacterium]
MNFRSIFHLISYMLLVLGIAVGACYGISRLYQDSAEAQRGLFIAGLLILSAGAVLYFITRGAAELKRKDGFGIVTFGWLVAAFAGALPYLLTGTITSPTAAIFETMSGFTTTGATVLNDLENLSRGVLFWRAFTQWVGGMGVLILCVAILPFLGVGGMQIFRAEMPGPTKDRLTPRIANTAKLLWGVYLLISIVLLLLLRVGGMSWFDSWCHMFTTIATGGFSPRTASIGAYNSLYLDILLTVFMLISGTNFALHFRALQGKPLTYFKDAEFRLYIAIWFGACIILTFNIWQNVYSSFGESIRAAFFQGTSILTTTGFVTKDFDAWPDASRFLLILLMFIGGCAGSTGGGIKVVRIFIALKKIYRETLRFLKPHNIWTIKLGRKPLEQSAVSHVAGFILLFMFLFAMSSFLMTFFTDDIVTAFSSVIATMSTIGPGLGNIGATETYADIPALGKIILTVCMLLGRLELYTVLIILLPSSWKR